MKVWQKAAIAAVVTECIGTLLTVPLLMHPDFQTVNPILFRAAICGWFIHWPAMVLIYLTKTQFAVCHPWYEITLFGVNLLIWLAIWFVVFRLLKFRKDRKAP